MITSIETYSEWRKSQLEAYADYAAAAISVVGASVAAIAAFISKCKNDKARAAKTHQEGLQFAEQLATETKRAYQTAIQKIKTSVSKLEDLKREAKSNLKDARSSSNKQGVIKQVVNNLIDDGLLNDKYEIRDASRGIIQLNSMIDDLKSDMDAIDTKIEFIKDYVGQKELSTTDAKKVYSAINYLIKKLAKVNFSKAELYTDRFKRFLKV